MTYVSASALRQAIEDRIRNSGTPDVGRLRRQLVFERILARLVANKPGAWILKGGVALELRMPTRARATRDLDLAITEEVADVEALVEIVVEALAQDPSGDRFEFSVEKRFELDPRQAGRRGWRLSVHADLDGRRFETIGIDVVVGTTELGRLERRRIVSSIALAGIEPFEADFVDLDHHFAEKLAAYTADHGDRENSRVKDLTDLVLFVETGLEPTRRLREVVDIVFAARGETPPVEILPPPNSWTAGYAAQAAEVRLSASTLPDAHRLVQEFWFASAEEIL